MTSSNSPQLETSTTAVVSQSPFASVDNEASGTSPRLVVVCSMPTIFDRLQGITCP